ncbi:MAG: type II toxin-antitoxin system VapC family toxin [Abitibacteriaceae bacterium]|nr:type II toxin-antitoxin system VapC family toxin [Abditibacteriaceae bacterium]
MILLDTHIWIWWVDENIRLSARQKQLLEANKENGLGVSVISCWEVSKLIAAQRISFSRPIEEWIRLALARPHVQLLDFTPQIAIESTQLPGDFHRDPADQIIVATARVYDCELITVDAKILDYPHVKTVK